MQQPEVVQGAITNRDLVFHAFIIVRLWGPGFYVRCLRAMASGKPCTFLDMLSQER